MTATSPWPDGIVYCTKCGKRIDRGIFVCDTCDGDPLVRAEKAERDLARAEECLQSIVSVLRRQDAVALVTEYFEQKAKEKKHELS